MAKKKVNPANILISSLEMEKLLVIDKFNDEVIKNNELLLDKPYFKEKYGLSKSHIFL